jgi:hypothetical protein
MAQGSESMAGGAPGRCGGRFARWGGLAAVALVAAVGCVLLASSPARSQAGGVGDRRHLEILPRQVELRGAGADHGLLVTLVGADGSRSDVTHAAQFSSSSSTTVKVGPNGHCEAVADGTAEVTVEHEGLTARVPLTVADSGKAAAPSFRQDVVPVLTRFGCNMGACHGKLAGQNGFKLSLRGYAPEMDYESLVSDISSRRIDFTSPESSLLLQKPVGQVPHEGGRRFTEQSRAYRVLKEWVEARAPAPDAKEADADSLEVLPGDRTLKLGETQQLLVRAHYPDGRMRDVTWLTQFFSNDESTVRVTPDGLVKSLRYGEAAVRAHFQGQVAVVTFATPFENAVESKQFEQKNNLVDEHVFRKLQGLRIPPSPGCDDATFVRRAFLDVTGTLPPPERVAGFVSDAAADKRSRLIDDLLNTPEYVDFWTLQLADLLQNRKERDHDVRGAKNVRAFHAWLRGQVAANRPWDRIARDLLTATGDSVNQPQIGYFIYTIGEKQRVEESDVTDSVAQGLLGTRIGCARCHNHPLEKYTQDDYYHFAAFFSKVAMKRVEPEKGITTLSIGTREEEDRKRQLADAEKRLADAESAAAEAKAGEDATAAGKKLDEARKHVAEARKQLDETRARPPVVTQPRTGKPMSPQPLDGVKPDLKPGEDPRAALAAWMTDPKNQNFSGAMVNRLWRHFMGVGLVEPVDDLRSSNPPSNRELFAALNEQFVSHGYNLKHVMRLILNSRAYQLGAETLPENEQEHRYYSHYYARRLPAEVLDDAVSAVTGVPDTFKGYPRGIRAVQLPEPGVDSYFLTIFGRSERVTACACERNGDVSLPQVLHLHGGEDVLKKVRSDQGRLAAMLKDEPDNAKVTEQLFVLAVARRPTPAEVDAVAKALAAGDGREDVFRDLFWALLNSKEFSFHH